VNIDRKSAFLKGVGQVLPNFHVKGDVGRSFFRFVTIYAFDRQTDEHLADGYNAAAFAAH